MWAGLSCPPGGFCWCLWAVARDAFLEERCQVGPEHWGTYGFHVPSPLASQGTCADVVFSAGPLLHGEG